MIFGKIWILVLIAGYAIFTQNLFAQAKTDGNQGITVDFAQVVKGVILDTRHQPCAKLMGKAKSGSGAIELGGAKAKGVVDFGKNFALSKTGTIELRCKPRQLSGIIIGKYGAINIEFVKNEKCVRFGIKLKGGARGTWVNCKSSRRSVKANQWVKIKASWGKYGLQLFLNDKLVAQKSLPPSFDWFSKSGRFVLGSYTWPGGYASWFLDGIIDDFSFSPTQEAPPKNRIKVKAPAKATPPGTILKLLLKKTPKPKYGVPVPDQVSGHITVQENGKVSDAENVSVTDGYSVVKTNEQGAYILKPDPKAVFIYITRPSGHNVVGSWYKPVSAKVDFKLKPAPGEHEYTFIHVSDTHTSSNRRSVEGLSRFVREANALAPKLSFVLNSGDLTNLSKSLDNSPAVGHAWLGSYVGIMNHLMMPYYNVGGDHSDSSYRLKTFPRGDTRAGKALFYEYLGPNFFSFEYGKVHFISVDFVNHLGKRQINGKEYPSSRLQPNQVKWLKEDMADRSKGTFVVTSSEMDLNRHCSGFTDMAKQHDLRLQLVGDRHMVAYKSRFVPYRIGGALSGCWWNPKTKDLCPDGSPRGYMIYRVQGEKMECFYKGLGQRVAITSHRTGSPWSGRVPLRAHVVQPKPGEHLEYSLNGKAWQPMRETSRPFYRAMYEATVDSTRFPDGLVELQVKSSLTGETRKQKIVIVNDNASGLFQSDATLTFTVGRVREAPKAPSAKVDVLFNSKVIGILTAKARRKYSFPIPAADLKRSNILSFRFTKAGDGMGISAPVLTIGKKSLRDPRDMLLRQVRTGHWGVKSADWGGFIIGDGKLEEDFSCLKQDVFCFVLPGLNKGAAKQIANPRSKPDRKAVIIWKELEELLPASGWSKNGYRSAKYDKKMFWTGKSAVRSSGQTDQPLVWRFSLKEELTKGGLNELVRTYAIWCHLYGYKKRKLTVSVDGNPLPALYSRNTEGFDKNGKYVSAGHYIWQKIRVVKLAGGPHKITLQTGQGQHLLLNALVLTTDLSIIPQYHELKGIATKKFAVSTPVKWTAYLENNLDVYGLTPGFTSMSWFGIKHSGKKNLFNKKARAVITLPKGIELTTASQRLVGVNWAYPKAPFKDWQRLKIDKKNISRNGKSFNQYVIHLSYLPPNGRQSLMLYLRTTLKHNTTTRGRMQLQWQGGKSNGKTINFRIVKIPETKGFRNILIGSGGGSWELVHPVKWPDFPDLITHCGLNAATFWGICGKDRPDMKLRQDTIQKFLSKGVQTLDNFSPWYSSVMPPKTIDDGAAADINGKLYKDYKNRTIPCPTFINGNRHIAKQLDHVRTIAGFGITGLMMDDERFNYKERHICFCPRCKSGYQAYLKKHHPKLSPMELVNVVRQYKKYPRHYEAWLVFRARGSSLRLAKLRNAFIEAATKSKLKSTFGKPFAVPFIHAGNGTLRNARESHIVDFPSLADGVDAICPMIYPVKPKYLPNLIKTLRNIRGKLNDKQNLWVTLNCGYSGGGAVLESQKSVIKYGILEAIMNGCKGITFWNGYTTSDPLSLAQIAAAVRIMQPHEKLILKSTVKPGYAICKDKDVNLSAISDGDKTLLLVSNYSKTPKRATINITGTKPCKVINPQISKTIAVLNKQHRSFEVALDAASRARLFLLK
jgi:calcineurin-like phosphoesterase family protein/concanavalin A-like lectin/glucanase superfamily protein